MHYTLKYTLHIIYCEGRRTRGVRCGDVITTSILAQASTGVSEQMPWLEVIVLSIIQGLTEFLPVSSSGHLRIASTLFFDNDPGASFTAVVQLGTEAAVLVYFAKDIFSIIVSWFKGLVNKDARDFNYRMGWMVIVGTIPVSAIGFLTKDLIRENLRNLWITATVLVLFSFVFIIAERFGRKNRDYEELTMRDAIVMGFAQCLALIPGVSRSGGTISAGLFSLDDAFQPQAGIAASGTQLIVGTLIAFVLGYASIAWLLKFVANNTFSWFAVYRIPLGIFVMLLLYTGEINPLAAASV